MIGLILDILTILMLLVGFFFMFVGALGVLRLPNVFNRMHAASKCVTLGITGMLLATVLHFARLYAAPDGEAPAWEALVGAGTKAVLVIVFLYTAAPVGSHMLARAALRRQTSKQAGSSAPSSSSRTDRHP